MTLATGPTLSCSSGNAPVAVIAFDGILPVQNAQVTILSTYSIMGIVLDSKRHDLTTNIMGLAQVCEENRLTKSYAVEAWIQKSNVDFGSGPGNPHHIGTVTGLIRAATPFTLFKAIAAPTIPPIPVPPVPPVPDICTAWKTAATVSLPNQLNPLSTIVNIYNAKWNCPNLNTSELISGVGRLKIGRFSTNFNIDDGLAFFDLKNKLSLSALLSSLAGVGSTNVEILIPNKDTGYTTFTKSISIPTIDIPDICTVWDTVATPNVPATMATSFPISVSGAKYVCRDFDDAEMVNGMGKIEIGGYTFDLPIQNGYGRVNLEDLMDLSTLTGFPSAPTVPTVPIIPETIIPPDISPYEPGSTTITLYLNDYIRNKIYTPVRGAYWGAGYFSRSGGYYNIHKATDASGTGDKYGVPCRLNVPKTHQYFGDYTITVLSVQDLGLDNASFTVKIKL